MRLTRRGKLLVKLAEIVGREAQRLGELAVRDNGKFIAEMVATRTQYQKVIDYIEVAKRMVQNVCLAASGQVRAGKVGRKPSRSYCKPNLSGSLNKQLLPILS